MLNLINCQIHNIKLHPVGDVYLYYDNKVLVIYNVGLYNNKEITEPAEVAVNAVVHHAIQTDSAFILYMSYRARTGKDLWPLHLILTAKKDHNLTFKVETPPNLEIKFKTLPLTNLIGETFGWYDRDPYEATILTVHPNDHEKLDKSEMYFISATSKIEVEETWPWDTRFSGIKITNVTHDNYRVVIETAKGSLILRSKVPTQFTLRKYITEQIGGDD
jgi:hypothetical protein